MDKNKAHELVSYLKSYAIELGATPTKFQFIEKYGNEHFLKSFSYGKLVDLAGLKHPNHSKFKKNHLKILLLDIETAPIEVYTWGLFDQNIALNQIVKDWFILSWSAKWLDQKEIFYQDQREIKDITNDLKTCRGIYKLINEADIIITHNGDKFDLKKLKARFIIHGFKPTRKYKSIDTLKISRNKFAFTSNKLEYIAKKLTSLKKMTKRKFSGFELWRECLKGNPLAWDEMEKYNKQDTIVLEAVYKKLISWDSSTNLSSYYDGENNCSCGGKDFKQDGYVTTNTGKYLCYICNNCGANYRDKKNLISLKDTLKPI